jgi:tRNA pseudouridine55 synthase
MVSCSGGTYIRTLCSDIGAVLGCGGHLKELKRIESSGFTINDAITLPEIEKLTVSEKLSYRIVSMTDALKDMPEYMADKALAEKIMHGKIITQRDFITEHVNNQNGFVKIVDTNNSLVAVIEHSKEWHRYNYCCVFNN